MAIETRKDLNGTNGVGDTPDPAVPYRDLVPPGTSRKPDKQHVAPARTAESPWQRVQIARHPDRPHTLEYIQKLCTDFVELHGDRLFGDDSAIIGGPACFEGQTVMVIGHQKGRTTKENIARNFGMPQPDGYRKAKRLMEHAVRFGMPILTFIDTPGANPGMQAEERGIAQAIADNIMAMLTAEVPIIATVIGEGGSGGAIAIAVGDRVLMLEDSVYSVASPESAAAILWHDAGKAAEAAEAMHIISYDLLEFGIIDEIIPEPEGGAHTDVQATLDAVREAIQRNLDELQTEYSLKTKKGIRKLLDDRLRKYERMGAFTEPSPAEEQDPASGE